MKITSVCSLLLIACFVGGCGKTDTSPDTSVQEDDLSTPPFIIDAHVHYKADDAWEGSFLTIYARHHAMACLMVRMPDLERGIRFSKAHPERIIPYAMIDIDAPSALDDVRKVHAMGYKGLGELFAKNEWNYDDPKYEPLWTLAEELGMPIAPHTGTLANGMMARLRPGYLATIASKHPNLVIVGAHFGNPWYEEAGEATRRNANLYFDLSGSSLIKKENNPGIWKDYLWWTPYVGKDTPHMPKDLVPAFEKIVFASDQDPDALEENIRRFNKMLNANDVSPETRAKCYGLTMAAFHGIKVDSSGKPVSNDKL
ncbi:MAG TPA: amidohydrolase family protein [Chryseosolibacter sp.]|jgi:predicted TIM-barrel fold metal-dependent hydrolase|nr:amidohydrolase family protein [Chryseosolibacter sp.]